MRKLATIRKISSISPIEGADAIELVHIDGWQVVTKRGEYSIGDMVLYLEIDSWVPSELAAFLSKGKPPRVYEGIFGERLRTIKLRGALSQGLVLSVLPACAGIEYELADGFDVTEALNILKYEKPLPAELSGIAKGNFPSCIPKTDQERCQNLVKEIEAEIGALYQVEEKLEGSSMTCYIIDGEFGVCSRNLDLKAGPTTFWAVAVEQDIESKMRNWEVNFGNFAVQGELIGPGIQGNIYNLAKHQFYVFDVFDIDKQEYVDPITKQTVVKMLGLNHVPVISTQFKMQSVGDLLIMADGQSAISSKPMREGLVFRSLTSSFTFKAISNKYLLGEK